MCIYPSQAFLDPGISWDRATEVENAPVFLILEIKHFFWKDTKFVKASTKNSCSLRSQNQNLSRRQVLGFLPGVLAMRQPLRSWRLLNWHIGAPAALEYHFIFTSADTDKDIKIDQVTLAHRYAIFLCSLDVEI